MKSLNLIKLLFSTVLYANCMAQSTTGKFWIKVKDTSAFSPRSNHQTVCFKDKIWLIGGYNGKGEPCKDVWNSDDAINWNLVTDSCEFEGGSAIVFKEKMWIINAKGKTIWNSSEGIRWEKISYVDNFAEGTRSVVFNNKMWLTGGADVINPYLPDGSLNPNREIIWKNDVWSSSDGKEWKKEATNSCFSVRCDHSVVVFDNKMWVIAGQSGPNKNDVWNSEDGINWNFVAKAPFVARHVTQSVAFENRLWVIAGFILDNSGKGAMVADVWCSPDGKNWEQKTSTAPFGKIQEHQAIVFDNKIWVIGGFTGSFENRIYKNDVWYTDSQLTDIKNLNKKHTSFYIYPNPSSSFTLISITIQKYGWANLKIFNAQGEQIETLINQNINSGEHKIMWNPKGIPLGTYYCQLKSNGYIETKKLIIN